MADIYRYIQIYTDIYRYIQVYTDIYRYIQVYTGGLPTKKEEVEMAKNIFRKPRLVKKIWAFRFFIFLGDFFGNFLKYSDNFLKTFL